MRLEWLVSRKSTSSVSTTTEAFSEFLAKNDTLTELSVGGCGIWRHGIDGLTQGLSGSKSLEILSLWRNPLQDVGACVFADALAKNSSLTKLRLEECRVETSGSSAIAQALCVNTSLTRLDMKLNLIGSEGAQAFGGALATNYALKSLHLDKCEIDDHGGKYLFRALSANGTLTALTMAVNALGKMSLLSLAGSLRKNTTLSELNLHSNCIGRVMDDLTAMALLDIISGSLSFLDLGGNQLDSSAAAVIAQGLRMNCSLADLALDGNLIDDEGVASLENALTCNINLTRLNLKSNHVSPDAQARFSQKLLANYSLCQCPWTTSSALSQYRRNQMIQDSWKRQSFLMVFHERVGVPGMSSLLCNVLFARAVLREIFFFGGCFFDVSGSAHLEDGEHIPMISTCKETFGIDKIVKNAPESEQDLRYQ
eukprot:TRINITY_DN14409_c0_g1_i11.p1 TRINITY_DN14409_c0_g1~~TRINITY_DN14409_c0_g1_i11.p1  ORF type:complete len:425 (-),score=89.17 TRINITY_DN14409_c0_g1_i11:230-1504(-)